MTPVDREDIVTNMEQVVKAARNGQAFEAELQDSLAAIIDWLAARVPYKEPLPRGYSILWRIRKDAQGTAHRSHQLLKAAAPVNGGQGVWIDTATLDQTDIKDIRVFADDLASGLLAEIITHLQQLPPAK